MQIQIPTADLKSALHSMLAGALAAEGVVAQSASDQLRSLVEELYPLVVSETQALLTATNPAVPQAYLGVLKGCIAAAVAKQGLNALAEQRNILSASLHAGIQILALVLRAAIAV